ELLLDRQIGIEDVERLLREVPHPEAGAERDVSRIGREDAGDDLQERRLAGAVLPHHAPALAAPNREAHVAVDDATAVRLADVLQRGNLIAGSRRRPEVELHDPALLRQLDALDLLERFHAALHLRRLGGMRGEALDEALLLREHRLLARVRRLAVGLARRAFA